MFSPWTIYKLSRGVEMWPRSCFRRKDTVLDVCYALCVLSGTSEPLSTGVIVVASTIPSSVASFLVGSFFGAVVHHCFTKRRAKHDDVANRSDEIEIEGNVSYELLTLWEQCIFACTCVLYSVDYRIHALQNINWRLIEHITQHVMDASPWLHAEPWPRPPSIFCPCVLISLANKAWIYLP